MSTETDAVNDILWLSKRFKGLLSLTDDLKQYGTLKDGVAELERKIAELRKTADETAAKVQEDQKSALEARHSAAEHVAKLRQQAEVDAKEQVNKAMGEAASIKQSLTDLLAKAKADATTIVSEAKEKAVAMVTEAQRVAASAEKARTEALAEVAEAKKRSSSIAGEVERLKAALTG